MSKLTPIILGSLLAADGLDVGGRRASRGASGTPGT